MLQYGVYFDNRNVGVAEVAVQGLYYNIQCRCSLFTKEICKLSVLSELGFVEIGVCIPSDSQLVLNKKIPIKTIGKEIIQFTMHQKRKESNTMLVLLEPNERFAYIHLLEKAKLAQKGNHRVLLISVNDQ